MTPVRRSSRATATLTPRDAPTAAAAETASVGFVAGGPLYVGGGGGGAFGGGAWRGCTGAGAVVVGAGVGDGVTSVSSGGSILCGGSTTAPFASGIEPWSGSSPVLGETVQAAT